MAALTDAVVPLLLLGASCYSLRKRADSYGLMVRGAADGLRMLAHIAPALIVLLTAVQMLQAAGAVQLLERFLGPVLAWTFYTICVYFGAAGVHKTRYAIPAALLADLTGFLLASWSVRWFF